MSLCRKRPVPKSLVRSSRKSLRNLRSKPMRCRSLAALAIQDTYAKLLLSKDRDPQRPPFGSSGRSCDAQPDLEVAAHRRPDLHVVPTVCLTVCEVRSEMTDDVPARSRDHSESDISARSKDGRLVVCTQTQLHAPRCQRTEPEQKIGPS